MAGNWYLGGTQAIEANTNAWVTETLRCSLVAGNALATNDKGWQTISDFTGGGNSFITNMSAGTATDVLLPAGRTVTYNTGSNLVLYNWPAGKVSFGSPVAAQAFCGILIHSGTVGVGTSTIYAFQSVTGTTQGGAVDWGSDASTNNILYMGPRTVQGAATGNGFMKNIYYDRAGSWNGGSDIYEFALARSGSFNADWATMADAATGLTYCTNCGFNGTANPSISAVNMNNPTWKGGDETFYFSTSAISGGLKWNGSLLSSGESAVGIIGYISSGSTGTSPIFLWNEIFPSITLTNNQDVFWDSFEGGSRTLMSIDITGN